MYINEMSDSREVTVKTGFSIGKDAVVEMLPAGLITPGNKRQRDELVIWGCEWEVVPKRLLSKTGSRLSGLRARLTSPVGQRGHSNARGHLPGDPCPRDSERRGTPRAQQRRFYFCTTPCPRSVHAQGHPTSSPPKATCSHTCSRHNILEATAPTGNDPVNEPISPSPAPAEPWRPKRKWELKGHRAWGWG